MQDKIKVYWDWLQSMLDVDGDIYMGLMTLVFIIRVALVIKGYEKLSNAEVALYSAAIGAFSYSNTHKS